MVMNILFTISNITEKQEEHLMKRFPDYSFAFLKDKGQINEYIQNTEVLVTYGNDVTAEIIEEANALKWIQVLSAGIDPLPLEEIAKKNITITNARGIHKTPMSEYAISMLLHVYRREREILQNQQKNLWDRSISIDEISGKTMLILGTGAIGQEIARLGKAFHMKTIGISRSGEDVEYFDEVYQVTHLNSHLHKGDFIISILPSTKETTYLLTDEHFDAMKEQAIFLNMGRGDLVKTETILKAARENKVNHIILDVFEEEPLPENSPLWEEDRITITPHLSGVSTRYLERALGIFKQNLLLYTEGEELENKVNIERGY